jgi:hypothetical protein
MHVTAPPFLTCTYALQVLLAKPLLVVAPSPADCSSAVAALISLIAPLPYRPDFRWEV